MYQALCESLNMKSLVIAIRRKQRKWVRFIRKGSLLTISIFQRRFNMFSFSDFNTQVTSTMFSEDEFSPTLPVGSGRHAGVGLSNPQLSQGRRRMLDLVNRLHSTGSVLYYYYYYYLALLISNHCKCPGRHRHPPNCRHWPTECWKVVSY